MKNSSKISEKGSSASKRSSASKGGDPLWCLEEDTQKKKSKVSELKQKMSNIDSVLSASRLVVSSPVKSQAKT